MPVRSQNERIQPGPASPSLCKKGAAANVTDPYGEQVADLVAFAAEDKAEAISSGRSIDYASNIFLSVGDVLTRTTAVHY